MIIEFPSREFDDVVAAICHGSATDEQMRSLNILLRCDSAARDEYILRVELHSRLASNPDLFASQAAESQASHTDGQSETARNIVTLQEHDQDRRRKLSWAVALAACLAFLAILGFLKLSQRSAARVDTSAAVAVLNRVARPEWASAADARAVGTALGAGPVRLKAGLAQLVFYSGARVVIEGPAELDIVSSKEAFCHSGRLTADVPMQARGFRVRTPQADVVDRGTEFGLEVKGGSSEVHVFKGLVECKANGAGQQNLKEGEAEAVENNGVVHRISADAAAFAALFDLERQSQITQELRLKQWRGSNAQLNNDPSLLVHFDFEEPTDTEWALHNAASAGNGASDAAIIGCQWTDGRWPGKRALEFRSISDRVRVNVPGEFRSLTAAAWVNVKGLDRQFNSLFMCDGFDSGKIHWQIRSGGELDLGVQGQRVRDVQIFASPPVVDFSDFGQWIHLAIVLDGDRGEVVHYVNGAAVSRHTLEREPPFRIGEAELGNWNSGDIPNKPPFMIRYFSGAMDEFELFGRPLSAAEIHRLYEAGNPVTNP